MKNTITLILTSIILFSCSKEEKTITEKKGISYPETIYFGGNILSYPDSSVLNVNGSYEMGAELEADSRLNIIFNNLTDTSVLYLTCLWGYSNPTGWSISSYDNKNKVQKFFSSQTGKVNLQMIFFTDGQKGTVKIDFYENSNSVTKTKYFFWQ
ncbi:MAG: hypothetical protein ACOYMA_04980 [Bacteroidia bacterium]